MLCLLLGARVVIYKDVFSGDELFTDAFDITVVDDFFLEIDGKMMLEGGDEIDIGGNDSAEGGGEDGEEAVKVCNVVSAGRLQETNFGKKDYVAMYKGFMKVGVSQRAVPPRSCERGWAAALVRCLLRCVGD